MVEGFVGPCMLGAMGIIFVAFLAPSGMLFGLRFLLWISCPACSWFDLKMNGLPLTLALKALQ